MRRSLVSRLDPAADAWLASVLPDARNLVVAPLTADGHAVGVLVSEHGQRMGPRIERRVVGMLERFVSHGTLALRNAWLLEQVRRSAATDGLTGLANRSSFDTALDRELARAERQGEPVALVLADIDHFKHLNDTQGHQTGDETLRRVARALEGACREMDTPARFGGEEFAVLLPGATTEGAVAVAERMRAALAADPEVGVTVSAGVACFPSDAPSAAALVAAADEALYESKRAGRDRVTVWRGSAGSPLAA